MNKEKVRTDKFKRLMVNVNELIMPVNPKLLPRMTYHLKSKEIEKFEGRYKK